MSCTWPVDRTCLPVADTELDAVQQAHAEDLAVMVLWALSGRQFGACPVITRPCRNDCGGFLTGTAYLNSTWQVVWDGSNWRNVACGCGPKCSWVSPSVVHLPSSGLPIHSVTEVVIAGELLDDAEYRLEGDLLYRVGGQWPSQDLTRPLDEPGTWSVTFTRGTVPPAGTDKLVGLLTQEFLSACAGGKCRLPRTVRSVSRQGVSYDMVETTDILKEGKTGIPEIDIWLAAVNPHHHQQAATVR